MEGLEISEVKLSEVVFKDNYSFRLDSPYFQKEFLQEFLPKCTKVYLSEIADIKSGSTPADRDDNLSEGIILLKTTDIRNDVLNLNSDYYFINTEIHRRMLSTELKKEDVLINIVGATTDVIGRASIIPVDFPKSNITQAMAFCRIRENKIVNPYFLFSFFTTTQCHVQLRRIARPTGQYNMNLTELGLFKVPIFSSEFQNHIEVTVKLAIQKREESRSMYQVAERALLERLKVNKVGGGGKLFKNQLVTNIKSFSSSFLTSGRLDSEYYQPKFEQQETLVRSNALSVRKLGELTKFNARGLQPLYDEFGTLSVINSRHILETELDYKNFEKTSAENWEIQERAQVFENDILTYTTGANIGRTQVYLSSERALASNHVNVIRLSEENPVYVAFVINSQIGRLQTDQLSAGSAQQELYPKDLEQFYIPFVEPELENKIIAQVLQGNVLKTQSEQLLERAKRAVEVAIEGGEEVGKLYLEN